MTVKLTVYVDDSIRKMLNDAATDRSISEIVNDALETYLAPALISNLRLEGNAGFHAEFPSISEVKRKRPKVSGSSSEIISSQRRGRNDRVSR